jgi:hypothetical protein
MEEEMDWYTIAKDFAGPLATIIAAITVARITWVFQSRQAAAAEQQIKIADAQRETAEGQWDIAYDRLKYDTFKQRYEIYEAAKKVIEAIFNQSPVNEADPEIKRLRLKLDEARFYFPSDTRALCENIEQHVHAVLVASHASKGYDEARPERMKLREKQSKEEIALANIYPELAKKFERDLGFKQLTQPHPSAI